MKNVFLKVWGEWREILRESVVLEYRSLELSSLLGLECERRENLVDSPTGVMTFIGSM